MRFLFRWIGTMILFTYHKGHFGCSGGGVLHTYLVGLLVVLGLIILSLCAIVYVSAQGTITNPGARRSMPALVYLRALLYIPELVWACLGAVWVSDNSQGCDPATVGGVITAVVTRQDGGEPTCSDWTFFSGYTMDSWQKWRIVCLSIMSVEDVEDMSIIGCLISGFLLFGVSGYLAY
ncbi:hypothetical protein ILYODFUR_032339 [Ilyodon furcidens]|uniref:MARVEL domain-containing protein n=1 Tax=Ilyodon furcidens TaxID=33524 RepID=A0ABV0VAI1_9TELE